MTDRLESLMIEHECFAVHKLKTGSLATLESIVAQLRPFFLEDGWDAQSEGLLMVKTQNKIGRIRTSMLTRKTLERTLDSFTLRTDAEQQVPDNLLHTLSGLEEPQKLAVIEYLINDLEPYTALKVLVDRFRIFTNHSTGHMPS